MNDVAAHRRTTAGLDVEAVRRDFPCLHQTIHGHPLVFLDSASSEASTSRGFQARSTGKTRMIGAGHSSELVLTSTLQSGRAER